MPEFIPPKHNPIVLAFLRSAILPLLLRTVKLDIQASANSVKLLRTFRNRHAVLMVNHCDRYDPIAVFALSKLCGQNFYYLAARELFEGLTGWIMQNSGSYSVIRGVPEDKESKEMTIGIASSSTDNLVMFPEGDVTGRDDFILSLKEDGIRNLFEAQQRMIESGNSQPLYLLPLVLYYDVMDDAVLSLENSLRELEDWLSLPSGRESLQSRVYQLVSAFIEHIEHIYGVWSIEQSQQKQLRHICRQITNKIARVNGLMVRDDLSDAMYLQSVRAELRDARYHNELSYTEYGFALRKRTAALRTACLKDLDRVQSLLILARTLEQKTFTIEIAWRIIDRLEYEIVGTSSPKGNRAARLDTAEPINLLEFYDLYLFDQSEAIQSVIELLRSRMLSALDNLKQKSEARSQKGVRTALSA